ncbi:Hsp20/alpha crystallin family protein [Streptomyces sp. NPDC057743]|uniref:Hsp20/alpha crystallin family protein n=1 Tax=Streptomyces sp. NPDC057743 TaxID=3346236 RepID=UPI0036BBE06E
MGNVLQRHPARTLSMQDVFDRLESGILGGPWHFGTHEIRIEEHLGEDAYQVKAELPGIDPEKNLEIDVTGDFLTIRAEREERTETKESSEFHYGSFARAVRLPAGARSDRATAEYTDGILTVRVPLEAAKGETTKVPVTRGTRAS